MMTACSAPARRWWIPLLALALLSGEIVAQTPRVAAAPRRDQPPRARTAGRTPAATQPADGKARSVRDVPISKILAIAGKIDQLILDGYRKNEVRPNPPASHEEVLRRVYLDVVGRIPTYREATKFLDSNSRLKRSELIDELLDSEGYVSHYFNIWADILRVKSYNSYSTGMPYVAWVKDSLRQNKPYDQFVRELLTAEGYPWENGASGYYHRDLGMPLDNMSNTTQIFLGTRLVCAQCHDHPFDVWTQMEYHEMAAFTFGVQASGPGDLNPNIVELREMLKKEPGMHEGKADVYRAADDMLRPLNYHVWENRAARLTLPHDYKYKDARPLDPVKPATIMGKPIDLSEGDSPRDKYAQWVTSPENPRFTQVIANRLWKQVFGVGVIEPVDDIREDTKPSNPDLLKLLTETMIELKYDTRQYLRVLLNTRTYQLAMAREERDPEKPWHFPGPSMRRLSSQQLWDSFLTMAIPDPDHRVSMEDWQSHGEHFEKLRNTPAAELLEIIRIQGRVIYAEREYNKERNQIRLRLRDAEMAKDEKAMAALKMEDEQLNKRFQETVAAIRAERDAARRTETPAKADKPPRAGRPVRSAGGAKNADSTAMTSMTSTNAMQPAGGEQEKKPAKEDPKWRDYPSNLLRASELRQPAGLDHFLRIFGQSDREVIENANYEASVTQILALINGPLYNQMMRPNSVLVQAVNSAPTEVEKIQIIFLSILSRPPTKPELKLAQLEVARFGPEGYGNVVWSLLNTRQFTFYQ